MSVRTVPRRPAAFAYMVRNEYAFQSGSTTWRTVSRMPASVTEKSAPRRIGDASSIQRIASAPYWSNISFGSG